jgi:hypothetical protein
MMLDPFPAKPKTQIHLGISQAAKVGTIHDSRRPRARRARAWSLQKIHPLQVAKGNRGTRAERLLGQLLVLLLWGEEAACHVRGW